LSDVNKGVKSGGRQRAFIDRILDMACLADDTDNTSVYYDSWCEFTGSGWSLMSFIQVVTRLTVQFSWSLVHLFCHYWAVPLGSVSYCISCGYPHTHAYAHFYGPFSRKINLADTRY